jgi:ABC-type sugar transport system ATPase subunit
MTAAPILQVQNLSKSFPGVKALEDVRLEVRLEVEAGKVHALMGENGAGKSTLMKILIGLHSPDRGEILFKGKPVRIRNPHDALRLGIAMIHQELLPFRNLTVAENIFMGQEPTRWFPGWLDRRAMNRKADGLLQRLGVMLKPDCKMDQLAVAEMQTVEIAKALAHHAEFIIMDEPTSAISDREVEALFKVIRDLKERGVAVIYISHKMGEIFRIADTVTVLRDGRHIATQPSGELDEKKLIALMVGRELMPPSVEHGNIGDPVLEIRCLTCPGKFRDISFTVRAGEILGLAGLMGAGRTDVAGAIYGLAPAASGDIFVRGRNRRITSPNAALAAGIALVSEDRREFGLVPQMSVKHNITLASLRNRIIDQGAENAVAEEQIRAFTIKTSGRNQPVVNLSGGNQQKVVIAKALLTGPDILILDEPARGIDIGAKTEVYSIINRVARSGKAVLLISSELPELLSLSDRVLVMREGEITAELNPRQTTQEEILGFAMPN